ncbi:hypothetical protein T484DRAFT_1809438 [Baffinella frigidus]|nr:hypothetical protein T484DRAFT_1809438 [Cryptophyta sp. CCMP2293]
MPKSDKKSREEPARRDAEHVEEKREKNSRRHDADPKRGSKRDEEKVEVKAEPVEEGASRRGGGKAAAEAKDEKIELAGVKRDRPLDDDIDVDDYDADRLDEVLPEEDPDEAVGLAVKVKAEAQRFCPYLDSISRHILDFDFEKVCSVSNSHLNVYACLVCGKYFQGRARGSPVYFHSLEHNHHVFMKLDTGRAYCIPDNYEVLDTSLADIKHNLNPLYNPEQASPTHSQYIPGTVGLNNLKNTAYLNVIVQSLSCVGDLRHFFLIPANYVHCKSLLVQRFGELLRKIWNDGAFKGQVSPHELFQAISVESNRKYRSDAHSDPAEFLNCLHRGLGGTNKPGSSIIHKVFQGQVKVESKRAKIKRVDDKYMDEEEPWEVSRLPFLHLSVDLPSTPLYADAADKNIIPQVPLQSILSKFNGLNEVNQRGTLKRFRLQQLPRFLIITVKRFSMNTQFEMEKNPTIVSFPIKNLDLRDFVEMTDEQREDESIVSRYDLCANVCHEGLVTKAMGTNEAHDKGVTIKEGVFRAQCLNMAQDQWFLIDDLHIQEILPQVVSISEAYIQIYERSDISLDRRQRKGKLKAEGVKEEVKEEDMMQ